MLTRVSLTITVIVGSVSFSTNVFAQTCEQALAQQDAVLRELEGDARREGVDFLLDDTRRLALAEAEKRLKGDPTADAAREIKARFDEYQAYVDQGKTFLDVAQRLSQCLQKGTTGCIAEIKLSAQREMEASRLASRINDAVQKWIDSLGNESISRAAGRVDRARKILENYTNRAAGAATQAASQGINSCLRDFDRRVQQAQNNPTPVSPRQPQPPPPSAAPKKGMSVGKTVALIGIPAVTAAALVPLATKTTDETNNGGGGGSSSDQIRLTNSPAIQCSRAAASGLQSLCTGQIALDVGNVFSSGTQVCIRTDPSAFFSCATRGSSGQMTFQIDERIINLDLNGNITGCRPVQSGIFVYRGPDTGVAAVARVTANIPVSCN